MIVDGAARSSPPRHRSGLLNRPIRGTEYRWHIFRQFNWGKSHAFTIFTRINRRNVGERNSYASRLPSKARLEFDEVVSQHQIARRFSTDIENNLPILYELARDLHGSIHEYGEVWGQTIVSAPFVNGANEIGACRRGLKHIGHLQRHQITYA